ncbi:MAG: restriction endonuclease subunit S [Proteobacteria bacterium]|nr:restriction endonuclease subunit S [Pseudomonadota bacterium]
MTLPRGWSKVLLGDCMGKSSTVDPQKSKQETFDLYSVPSYTGYEPEVQEGAAIGSTKQQVQEGDVLLCKIVPHIRRGWTVPKSRGRRQIASGEWIIFRNHGLESEYLRRFVLSDDFHDQFMQTVSGVGGSLMRARPSEAARIAVPIPPLAEQRRIVKKLDALTARITRARAELERVPVLAANMRRAILSEAFSGALTSTWRSTRANVLAVHISKVREERRNDTRLARRKRANKIPKFEIPASWSWISPDEIASDVRYSIGIGPFGSNLLQSDYRESGIRLVFVRDIRRERFGAAGAKYIEPKKAKELHQHMVAPGDVLITKMGDPPGDSSLFPVNAEPAVITADCIKITPHPELVRAKYLNLCIKSELVQSQFKAITAGVAQQKVSLDRFRQLALPIAPLEEQSEIIQRIEAAFTRADRLEAEATRAKTLLDRLESTILAEAFRGELVPQDPTDEPAETLLSRIHAQRTAAPAKRGRRKAG